MAEASSAVRSPALPACHSRATGGELGGDGRTAQPSGSSMKAAEASRRAGRMDDRSTAEEPGHAVGRGLRGLCRGRGRSTGAAARRRLDRTKQRRTAATAGAMVDLAATGYRYCTAWAGAQSRAVQCAVQLLSPLLGRTRAGRAATSGRGKV
ncbi:hypothetical protein K458DRAFT_114375 [Lentithecium fluviatile CBS 122367]|uniref:Uncharacterized protein n=1 Tax=Lentithecium fluviatile CBS 122367 TaxID=1168545 RepID=A0A6G1IPL7_9PLEO|nr:hypothetical protein K458DRAFT_114375 [Lentithecium fluviatile CBS 122367]